MPKAYLYVIRSEEGPVKIGISTDPQKRIARLSATSGRAIVQTFISPAIPQVERLEQLLHEHFAAQRTVGEWFDIEFRDAVREARHLGAMHFPESWKVSADYVLGAGHRDRMRQFANGARTATEWNAFFAGMGREARELAELADQVDSAAMEAGMRHIAQQLAMAPIEPTSAVMDQLKALRDELNADLQEAGLSLSRLSRS